jgi:hypothetical protein
MSKAADPQNPRRPRIFDVLDKSLFLFFFIGGGAAIISLKYFGYNQWTVTGIPVAFLLLYPFCVSLLARFRLRADRLGDNCYYLGFLYTLISLGYALFQFEVGSAGTINIIENFGIALASTVVGLALRVFINQFRDDPIDIERDARLDLAEAATRLRSELETITRDFKQTVVAMGQAVDEAVNSAAEHATSSLETNSREFQKVTNEVLAQLKASFEAHNKTSVQLNEISKRTASAFERVIGRIEDIQAPNELLAERLKPAVEEVEKLLRALADERRAELERAKLASDLGTHLSELTTRLDGHFSALAGRIEQIEAIAGQINTFQSAFESAGAGLGTLATASQASSADLQLIQRELQRNLEVLKAHNQSLEGEIERSREATIKIHKDLADAADLIVERLSTAGAHETTAADLAGSGR